VNDALLTAEQVADLLSVSVNWVREATRSGAIPAIPLGRYWRYRESSILDWLDQLETRARGDWKPRKPVGPS
jgi:excisionase family DNA binding protein